MPTMGGIGVATLPTPIAPGVVLPMCPIAGLVVGVVVNLILTTISQFVDIGP